MSVHYNRGKYNKGIDSRSYRILFLQEWYPPYWDEGYRWYPKFNRGFKTPNKQLLAFKMREFKTWKHNRKTQWK